VGWRLRSLALGPRTKSLKWSSSVVHYQRSRDRDFVVELTFKRLRPGLVSAVRASVRPGVCVGVGGVLGDEGRPMVLAADEPEFRRGRAADRPYG